MRKMMLGLAAVGCLVILPNVTSLNAQGDNPQPTCKMYLGTYIPIDELQAYLKKAIAERQTINRCATSISARLMSLLALCIAESWTYRRRTRSPSTIWSVKSITSSTGRARWCWVPISST